MVTIVVLIILATISINAVMGENGLIRQAEIAGEYQANAEAEDRANLGTIDEHLANAIAKINGESGETPKEPQNPTVTVTGVTLDKESETIAPNGTLQLTATVSPEDATNKNVTWTSSTPSVATVNQTGLVTAVSVGSTTITVTTEDGAKTASCSVTVEASTPLTSTVTSTNHTGTAAEDTLGNPVYIPGGFRIASDSGSTVKEGIVIEDGSGNQFVWIPVSNINHDGSNKIKIDETNEVEITLGRYTFDIGTKDIFYNGTGAVSTTAGTYQYAVNYETPVTLNSEYQELTTKISEKNEVAKNLQRFVESVRDNHGYYLARYEASYASGSTFGIGNNSTYYKPASKVSTATSFSASKVGSLWNNITQADASKASQNMYYGNEYVESDLVNSYAWDTAIVYIQAMTNSNYACANRNTTGNRMSALNTGATKDEKCKIFDLAANIGEWSTEYSTGTYGPLDSPCTFRGGTHSPYSELCTVERFAYSVGYFDEYIGFRPILYVK